MAPPISNQVVPPSLLFCHCTKGAGAPLAAALKVATAATVTPTLAGCTVTSGGAPTVSVAPLLVAEPEALVKITRYLRPVSASVVVGVA